MSTSDNFAKKNTGITPSSFSTREWMNEIEFLVPLYQRLFVWEEEQITQLLEDLEKAYRANTAYYIGTLTVYRHPTRQSTWELVDGQQRITVLNLLGACLDKIGELPLWKPFLVKGNGLLSRLRYFAREEDQKDLEKIRKEGFKANNVANANMKRFIDVFEHFTHKRPSGFNLSVFSQFVYDKTTALIAFLPESYELNDLNLYFEKINAVGKQLEAHEVLKGRYFGKYSAKWNAVANGSEPFCSKDEKAQDRVALSLQCLLRSGGDYKHEPPAEAIISDSSRLVMSFPVFLLHSLRICVGPDVEIDGFSEPKHLLSTFRQIDGWWKENHRGESFPAVFVKEMEAYRQWMDKWIIHIEDARPVSPYQQDETRTDRYECAYKQPLWQFQSMLYVSGGEWQKWVLDAYQDSAKAPLNKENKDGLLTMLKQRDKERHPFRFEDSEPEKFSYNQIERYWFWKLDYILWENRKTLSLTKDQKDAVDAYTFQRNRSIEHLHPQTQNPDNQWDEKDLHAFGNLAMISARFNSQQSNDTVGTKFGRLGDKMAKKELESIKLLLMFIDADGKDVQWTKVTSEKHCSEMIKVLKGYYAVACGA